MSRYSHQIGKPAGRYLGPMSEPTPAPERPPHPRVRGELGRWKLTPADLRNWPASDWDELERDSELRTVALRNLAVELGRIPAPLSVAVPPYPNPYKPPVAAEVNNA